MRSYDQPDVLSYDLGAINFTSGAATSLPVPSDVSGARILGFAVQGATVAFTADTTPAYLDIGTAADADKFLHGAVGVVAATDSKHVLGADIGIGIDLARGGDAGVALAQLEVTFVAPTGGTPAGTGRVTVFIGWY